MIHCNNIYKKYSFDEVLIGFSYSFPDNGFVLLYGESGCGKTTLLNILSGITDFDKGEIIFKNKTYNNRVDLNEVSNDIGYITQDPHFIDYLTVLDNLKLCSMDDRLIDTLLAEFGLSEKKYSYPCTLSGGEKQRVAIIQALLGEKDILFFDEPTASLDKENKFLIFKILEALKKSKLIICSSHDDEAIVYADEIIDFNDLSNIQTNSKINVNPVNIKENKLQKKRKLQTYINKMYSYPGREKKSRIILIVVFTFTFFALCICDTPKNKTESNIKYTYHLNQIQISCHNVNKALLRKFTRNKHAMEVDLMYDRSVPDGIVNEKDIYSSVNYNLTAKTIPFNKDAFRLSNCIAYGTYFTKAKQIILSHEMAVSIGNPEDIIGETLKVDMYDKSYEMEIVGVFRKFTKIEKQYLWASGVVWTDGDNKIFFINGEFTKRYINDKKFFSHGERIYTIYFDTFNDMKSSYAYFKTKKTGAQFIYADISNSILFLFQAMFIILLPIVLVIIPIAILLYYQTRKIEMVYNKHIFSIYKYLGYSVKEIKICWVISSFKEILKIIGVAVATAIPIMIIINFINIQTMIIPFQIFTFNIYFILLLIIAILLFSIIVSMNTLKKVKMIDWYGVLLEQRDLI